MKILKGILLLVPLTVVLLGIGYLSFSLNLMGDLLPVVSVYGLIIAVYFGVRVLLHFLNKPFTKPFLVSTSIVLPFYEEDPDVFIMCLKSCLAQNPSEVIAVDDGSSDLSNYENALMLARHYPNLVVFRQETNQGKRHAQGVAFRVAKGDVLVTVDSDTVLEKDALKELIKPFIESKTGAVTGQLSLLNKSDNFLTTVLNIRYIVAGVLERAAYSYFGVVNCTSGPLSAYRKSLVMQNLDNYLNQTHLGKRCTFGDDRHLTMLILRDGYSVFYQKTAKARTVAPNTFKGFAIQQLRWNRSFWRENWFAIPWMWRRSTYLTIGTTLDMALPFLYFGSLIWSISVSTTSLGLFLLFPLFVSAPLMAFIRNFDYFMITRAKDYALVPLYSWIFLFVLLPITFFAFFTTSKTGWGTRSKTN